MRYIDLELLGQGSATAVYKAYDPRVKRFVALKVAERLSPASAARLLKEARAQARLRDPHLCEIYEVGDIEGRPFIAMELIDGPELAEAAATMSLRERVEALARVARAVDQLHLVGLIHRDLKPANILVEKRPQGWHPRLIDFGIVHEIDAADAGGAGATRTGQVLGTPYYMAPEQAAGERGKIDRRTDVYGLGATLYELATGQPPFAGTAGMETLLKVLDEEPRPPSALDPALQGELEAVIQKAMAKEPERRYASALELAQDLERWLAGNPIHARRRRTGWWKKLPRKHRSAAGVLLGSGLLLAGCTTLFWSELKARSATSHQVQLLAERGARLSHRMRSAHTSPQHDIRYIKRQVEAEIAALSAELPGFDEPARSAAHLALGRGYFELFELDLAREHLEKAWQGGVRPPELTFALVRTLGYLYERELSALSGLPAERRAARRRSLEQEIRAPALTYLEASPDLDPAVAEYLRATVWVRDRQLDAALTKVQRALNDVPWLYEARSLEAAIHLEQSLVALEAAAFDQAQAQLTVARRQFEAAIAAAPSFPPPHIGLCGVETLLLQLAARQQPQVLASPTEAERIPACAAALGVDPERAGAYLWLSNLANGMAVANTWQGVPAVAWRESAIHRVRQAHLAEPHNDGIRLQLGMMLVQAAWSSDKIHRDQVEAGLGEAEALFRAALTRRPLDGYLGLGLAATASGFLAQTQALADPRPSFDEALAWLTRAESEDSENHGLHLHLGLTRTLVCEARLSLGGDAEAACRDAVSDLERASGDPSTAEAALYHLAVARFLLAHLAALRGDEIPAQAETQTLWQQLAANPATRHVALLRLSGLQTSEVVRRMARRDDPRASLEAARVSWRRVAELAPEDDVSRLGEFELELLALEDELARGGSGRNSLRRVERAYHELRAADRHGFAHQKRALLAFAEARVALAATRGGGASRQAATAATAASALDRALALVEDSQRSAPHDAESRCLRGALGLLAAQLPQHLAEPPATAVADLSSCLEQNPHLGFYYRHWLDEARSTEAVG